MLRVGVSVSFIRQNRCSKIDEVLFYCKSLNILYIEDDKDFAYVAMEMLQRFFHQVDLSNNAKEALDRYVQYYNTNTQYYDIVITDIKMPKVSGLELVKKIYNYNAEQSVIVISAHNETNYLLEFLNMGIEYFVVKSFDINDIVDAL